MTAPITLKEACALFPGARLTVSTLRAEAARGRLTIFRIGRRDYTTAEAMQEMVRLCQESARHRVSISTQNANSGQSETERASSALASLNATVIALKKGWPRISGRNTNRRAGQIR